MRFTARAMRLYFRKGRSRSYDDFNISIREKQPNKNPFSIRRDIEAVITGERRKNDMLYRFCKRVTKIRSIGIAVYRTRDATIFSEGQEPKL